MQLTKQLEALDEPVRVGVIGAGVFGSQLIGQIERVPGLTTAVVADIVEEKAVDALRRGGVPAESITAVDSGAAADAAYGNGKRAVLDDGGELTVADVDVVVEATGVPEIAARHAFRAISNGKHVVMVSVQTDALVGPVLGTLAENNGVTYSMAYGDQPAQMVELCDWATTAGLEIVAAGRTMGDPNRYITPDEAMGKMGAGDQEFFEKYEAPHPKTVTAAVDGTKVAIEACAAGNAVGLTPDKAGMHMPEARIRELPDVFRPKSEGGILDSTGVIDAVRSEDPFSVFVVTTTENEKLRDYVHHRLSDQIPTSDDGKYQAFYRPFHFAAETTVSVANAAVRNEATGTIRKQRTEVVGAAKRDLGSGDEIDGSGRNVYGLLVNSDVARAEGYVPLELLKGATVVEDRGTDDVLSYDDVDVNQESFLYALRTLQDDLT